jgi:hypothetical protein
MIESTKAWKKGDFLFGSSSRQDLFLRVLAFFVVVGICK